MFIKKWKKKSFMTVFSPFFFMCRYVIFSPIIVFYGQKKKEEEEENIFFSDVKRYYIFMNFILSF